MTHALDQPTNPTPSAGGPRPDASPDTRERPAPELTSVVRALVEPTVRAVPVYVVRAGQLVAEVVDRPVSPVLAELRAEIMPSQTAAGGGGGIGAAASLDVLDELNALASTVQEWLALAGLTERRRHATDRDPIEDGLRRLSVHHWTGDVIRRDQLARILDYRRRRAEAVLAGEVTAYYVRDTRCPACKTEHVRDDPEPGQRPGTGLVHRPLRVERDPSREHDGRPGAIRGTRCTACGKWWPWEVMATGDGGALDMGTLARELVADREQSRAEAAPPGTAEAARRSVELDQRAALYGGYQTGGSARRMGLPGYWGQ